MTRELGPPSRVAGRPFPFPFPLAPGWGLPFATSRAPSSAARVALPACLATTACRSPASCQRGVSLVEVLVSLAIVSMGVLALAGLVSVSARLAKSGESRAMAALLAGDLADRVRANPAGALAGAYDWRPAGYPALVGPPPAPAVLEPDCSALTPCTPAQVAAIDLYRWRQRLAASLPGGYGYVRSHPGSDDAAPSVDVWVAWTDAASLAYGEALPTRECPAAFGAPGATGTPRCLFLEVAP